MTNALLDRIVQAGAFRAIDRHIARWLADRSGSAHVGLAALAASAAEGAGSACADLAAIAGHPVNESSPVYWPDWETWKNELDANGWVGASGVLVLEHGLCYLRRNHDHERHVADALVRRCALRDPVDDGRLDADLDALFGTAASVDDQRRAVAAAAGRRVFVLTGGPGTGKTSTVLRLLLVLLRQDSGHRRIALAAPTGKAAQRLGESLRRGLADLEATLTAEPWPDLLQQIRRTEPATLHRLLGYRAWRDGFEYGTNERLPADLVVVDEASMIDLAMMRRLFDALPDRACVILLGDPDQLASVEAGSVLADIVAASSAPALDGSVFRLGHVWRAAGALVDLSGAIQRGDSERAIALLTRGDPADGLSIHDVTDARSLATMLRARVDPVDGDGVFDALPKASDPTAALAALGRFRLLTALREGPFGQRDVNRQIERLLRSRHRLGDALWYPGRIVIVTENDYALGLYNGDIGIALARGGEPLRVWFEPVRGDRADAPRAYAPGTLPAHEPAFAMTVHKSQGSEFDHIALLLPPVDSPLVTRELIYTGLTRARRSVELWGDTQHFAHALQRRVRRAGRLAERIGGV